MSDSQLRANGLFMNKHTANRYVAGATTRRLVDLSLNPPATGATAFDQSPNFVSALWPCVVNSWLTKV